MKPFVASAVLFTLVGCLALYIAKANADESDEQFIQDQIVDVQVDDIRAKIEREHEYKREQHEKFYDERPFLKALMMTIDDHDY